MGDTSKPPKDDKQSEPTKIKTVSAKSDIKDYLASQDFQEYLSIEKITGKLTKAFEDLTVLEQRTTISNYHQWVKLDRPKPSMPQMPQALIKSPVDLFRLKHRGKEKIYWDNTAGEKIGVTYKEGNPIDFTEEYTKEKAEQLMAEREQLLDPTQKRNCYIVLDGRPNIVHDTDFTGDFDKLANSIKDGSYHF